jgi:hypothetical protein
VEVQLFHRLCTVCLDRFDADTKRLSDFFGSAAVGDQAQDFALARRQPVK